MVEQVQKRNKSESVKVPVVRLDKVSKETVDVPAFMQARVRDDLMAQAVHTTRRRTRIRRAHTKERAEVRGGGRKPWRQKGTGRARHGSRRSPIWAGGGITFGPRSRKSYNGRLAVKQRRSAFASALSVLVRDGALSVLRLNDEAPQKTKDVVSLLPKSKGSLLVLDDSHKAYIRILRNVPSVTVVFARHVTVEDLLDARQVWVDEAALAVLESRSVVHSQSTSQ